MELSRQTDLSLRLLLYLAHQPPRRERVTMAEIARFYAVSHEHLRKVVHRLGRAGFVATAQGRRGGLSLGRAPDSIRIGDVVETMERDLSIVDCDAQRCVLKGPCTLKPALMAARAAFLDTLRGYSLADLIAHRPLATRFTRLHLLQAA